MYNRDRLEGFTEHATRVLHLAEVERQYLQDGYVGTEHLLLGLLGQQKGLAAKVLNDFGVDLHRVRYQIITMTRRGDAYVAHTVCLIPSAKATLARAASEARRLNDHSIGTGHLLLGLLRADKCTAIDILESLAIDRVYIRKQTLQLLYRMERSYTTNPPSFTGLSCVPEKLVLTPDRVSNASFTCNKRGSSGTLENPASFAQFSKRETTARFRVPHMRLVPLHVRDSDSILVNS